MITRKLDDYRYFKDIDVVAHIYEAQQPENYNPKTDEIVYSVEYSFLNSSETKHCISYAISSKNKAFWIRFKPINKFKGILLWNKKEVYNINDWR